MIMQLHDHGLWVEENTQKPHRRQRHIPAFFFRKGARSSTHKQHTHNNNTATEVCLATKLPHGPPTPPPSCDHQQRCLPCRESLLARLWCSTTGHGWGPFLSDFSDYTILSISNPVSFWEGKNNKKDIQINTSSQQNSRTYRTNTSNAGRPRSAPSYTRLVETRQGETESSDITNEVNFCISIFFFDALSLLLLQAQFRAAYLKRVHLLGRWQSCAHVSVLWASALPEITHADDDARGVAFN